MFGKGLTVYHTILTFIDLLGEKKTFKNILEKEKILATRVFFAHNVCYPM